LPLRSGHGANAEPAASPAPWPWYAEAVREIPAEVMAEATRLFWDVDPSTLDPEGHEDFIVGRVLVEGTWSSVRAVQRALGDKALASFVQRSGGRRLDRRTLRFFQAVLGLPAEPCETTSSPNPTAPLYVP
jgi:hypothetical protein